MKLTLLSVLTFTLITVHFTTRAQTVNAKDSLALVDLFNNTNGPNWVNNTNWLTTAPASQWFGIRVDAAGRIKSVRLASNKLKGSLAPSIGNLTAADTILLNSNNLSDSIPSTITSLNPIIALDISSNNFTFAGMEAIHSTFLFAKYAPQNNITFSMNANVFSVTVGGMLSNNTYTWYKNSAHYATNTGDSTQTVPASEVANEYALTVTNSHVPGLTLYSPYPLRVQDSLALVDLYDSTNGTYWTQGRHWTGPITNWGGIVVVKGRVIGIREVGGLILSGFHIQVLGAMSGAVPASFGNLTELQTIDFRYDMLTGLPHTIGNLKKLRSINLFNNALLDSIPVEIDRLSALTFLELSYTSCRYLQDSIGLLNQLATLNFTHDPTDPYKYYAQGSPLMGQIPASFGNLTNLRQLNLGYNNLSGSIPPQLGSLQHLDTLLLNNNNFTGTIPVSLGNCTGLTILRLGKNNLSDTIPASIGNLHSLVDFECNNNVLMGNIPNSLTQLKALKYIYLQNNLLSGSLPPLLNDSTKSISILLNNNHFSGDISSIQLAGSHLPAYTGNVIALAVRNNRFTFKGMETIVQNFQNSSDGISYAPQATIPIYRQGNVLSVVAGGTMANDTFRLFKNGLLVQAHTGDSSFIVSSTGNYNITVTNKIANQLTLRSDTLNVTSLPVTLLSFAASRVKSNVQLVWQTAQEINTGSYGIERSCDGAASFKSIGTVMAAGNTTIAQAYQFIDAEAAGINSGALYYRLKIVDKDRSYRYSKTVRLLNDGCSKAFVVYPDPMRTSCMVQFNATAATKYTLALTTADGKVVKRINVTSTTGINRVAVDVAGLPQATYFINITGDKQTTTLKVVKE